MGAPSLRGPQLEPLDDGKGTQISLRMPPELVEKLDEIAGSVRGWNRSRVIIQFLKWAISEYEENKKTGKR